MGCLFSARVVGFCFGCLLVVVGMFRVDAPIHIIWLFPLVACARLWAIVFIFLVPGCGAYFTWLLVRFVPNMWVIGFVFQVVLYRAVAPIPMF